MALDEMHDPGKYPFLVYLQFIQDAKAMVWDRDERGFSYIEKVTLQDTMSDAERHPDDD